MKKLSLIALILFCFATSYAQQTEPKIYNPNADAGTDIAKAVKKAKAEKKHVFIQVGGNWCVWCIRFHHLIDNNSELKTYLQNNYETVLVNYSKENKNETVMRQLKNPGRFGFPVFVILDDKGEVIHIQNSAYLEQGDGHSTKLISDFLKNWTYKAVNVSSQ